MESLSTGKLIIICGLPGSGKTTRAIQLQNQHRCIRLSADEWMTALSINLYDELSRAKTEALQWSLGKQLLSLGVTVIVEWGTWARDERDQLRIEARSLNASVDLHYLSASKSALYDRIQKRGREDPPISPEAINRWVTLFQVPTSEEMALYDYVDTAQSED